MSETDGKDAALTKLGPDDQTRTMAGEDMLDDRKAEPGPLFRTTILDIDAVKALGQTRHMLRRNAGAMVADADFRRPASLTTQ